VVKNKKAQVTIFIIIAVVIVAAVLIFLFATNAGQLVLDRVFDREINVEGNIQDCLEDSIENAQDNIDLIMEQGGSLEPELYFSYNGGKVEYLCYTNEELKTCVMQKPMLLQQVEAEISGAVEPEIKSCIDDLKQELRRRGYSVRGEEAEVVIDLVPEKMNVKLDSSLTVSKEGSREYGEFNIDKPTHAYELIMLSTSILNFEATYGDSDPLAFMMLYPEIRVEKQKQSDGTTIYLIGYRDTKTYEKVIESFNFATRSLAWPVGYI